ncbi:MAG TPA: hypothetical protein VJL29_00470, partial [Thermoguttaceae bacterium]|nr:hypothetical protein [Thermoguttaceae bacterium]
RDFRHGAERADRGVDGDDARGILSVAAVVALASRMVGNSMRATACGSLKTVYTASRHCLPESVNLPENRKQCDVRRIGTSSPASSGTPFSAGRS